MTREAVLLVHGHGAHPVLLEPLRRALERQGFRAVSFRYGSLRGSIEAHAAGLAATAKELDEDPGVGRLHFVGHSMGAIVVRRALAMARPRKLGRVVLLAPPNRGARLADLAVRLVGPRLAAATELSSHPDSYVNRLTPAPDLDCGVIAASWDHAVSLASTHLPGQRDHIVLRSLHTLPLHRHAPAQVGHFLREGRFLRESNNSGGRPPVKMQGRFAAGIEDVIILPLVAIAVAARKLLRATLSVLVHILDYAFPILLQLVRFLMLTARIIGDGVTAALKGVVRFLPVSGTAREQWRQLVSEYWSWLRQRISYKAFEEAVHHAFEGGMAWVFKTCRTLTPGGALLVIAGAILWLPISFIAATALHAVLIAKAASLPAWMQLLHPLATIIAKTKLLVLPAYPAAWPQAKKHSFVQAVFRFYQFVAAHYLTRKSAYRYQQTERAAADAGMVLEGAAAQVGLDHVSNRLLAGFNDLAARIGKAARAARIRSVRRLSALPLIGASIRKYAMRYDRADQQSEERLSEKVSRFFDEWSIKFSPEYYEAKEAEAKEASKGNARAQDGAGPALPPSAVSRPRADA